MSSLTIDTLLDAMRSVPRPDRTMLIVPPGYLHGYHRRPLTSPFGVRVIESRYLPTFESDAKRRRTVRRWVRETILARKLGIDSEPLRERVQPMAYLVSEPQR